MNNHHFLNKRHFAILVLCTLIAVAVWGDFASHGIPKYPSEKESAHEERLHLGWGFWVSVCATIFLFLANLLYLIRKDFQRESPQTPTDTINEKDRFPV